MEEVLSHFLTALKFGFGYAGAFLVVVVALVVALKLIGIISKSASQSDETIEITDVRAEFMAELEDVHEIIGRQAPSAEAIFGHDGLEKNTYILDFKGDIDASGVEALRDQISLICRTARECDEVVVRLESGGGTVHGYGLGAAELYRIKAQGIKLTVCVDRIAASGGYMMACVADRLICAPFAIIGSIGVISEFPNFNGLLEKNGIEYNVMTAGEHKGGVSVFGKNSDDAKEHHQDSLDSIHGEFIKHIRKHRPDFDEGCADGRYWYGQEAKSLGLVDMVKTSSRYIEECTYNGPVYQFGIKKKKSLLESVAGKSSMALENALMKLVERKVQARIQ